MKKIETTLKTTATYSDDGINRFLLKKEWDDSLPKLAIIMLAPSMASGIELDSSTLLVLNNASRLGFGQVDILNLFAALNDFELKDAQPHDAENLKAIVASAKAADVIVYAAGVGKAKNELFQARQKEVLTALKPYEGKLHCINNVAGTARLRHPLSPAARTWVLEKLEIGELLPDGKSMKVVAPKATKK